MQKSEEISRHLQRYKVVHKVAPQHTLILSGQFKSRNSSLWTKLFSLPPSHSFK